MPAWELQASQTVRRNWPWKHRSAKTLQHQDFKCKISKIHPTKLQSEAFSVRVRWVVTDRKCLLHSAFENHRRRQKGCIENNSFIRTERPFHIERRRQSGTKGFLSVKRRQELAARHRRMSRIWCWVNWYDVAQPAVKKTNLTGLLGMRKFLRFPSFNGPSLSKHSLWEFYLMDVGKKPKG